MAALAVQIFGGGRALADGTVTVDLTPSASTCPVPAAKCDYSDVSSAVTTALSSASSTLTWTLSYPSLPAATALTLTNESTTSDATNLSMTLDGTLDLPLGELPVQLSAVWSSKTDTSPQLVLAVQPSASALAALNPAWTNDINPNLKGIVLATSPQSGTLTVTDLPALAQPFYGKMTSLAVGPGVSIYAGVDTSSVAPALANALSYLGLGPNVSLSGTLSNTLNPLLSPAAAAAGIDLTIAADGTGSLPSWVTGRTASLEFSDPSAGPTITLTDSLTTSIAGATNTFSGSATVAATSFDHAQIDVNYQVVGSFQAPFGLAKLALSNTSLDLAFSTGATPSFTGSLASTVTVNSTALQLTTTIGVSQGTVTGTFAFSGPVSVADVVSVANSLLGTSASMPSGSTAAGLSLTSADFSFSTQSGEQQFALTAEAQLGSATADVLISLDDKSGTPKVFAGLHFANLNLGSLISGTSDSSGTSGLTFTSLDLFASSGYLSNGQPTSVAYTDLLPAEQTFFNQVYATAPTDITFGPNLEVSGAMALPADIGSALGITDPLTFTGDLGFGLDAVNTGTPPKLGGDLTVQLPSISSGLPGWLASTGPATLTLSADTSGDISLSVAGSATATISGNQYPVSLTGSLSHTAVATSFSLTGSLNGTFSGLFGASWLSLANPAVALDLTHTPAAGGQPATTSVDAAVTGEVTISGYQLSASLKLSGGSAGATATISLQSQSTASVDLATIAGDLGIPSANLSGLPAVSLTSLELSGTVSSSDGVSLDLLAGTALTLPGAQSPIDANLLLKFHDGGSDAASVVAGFELADSPSLAAILPAGDVPSGADFTLPNVALLVANPATTLTYADLDQAEQTFFQPFCGDASSDCHTTLQVASGISMVASFPLPDDMKSMVSQLPIPVPSGDVLLTGTVPVFGSGNLDLKIDLPSFQATDSTPDFFQSGQLSFEISLNGSVPSMQLAGTATFNIKKGSVGQIDCPTFGGVWRTPRGGGSAACYDQVPFSLTVAVQLEPVSLTLTGGLADGYTWKAPLGATWLTLNLARIQLGITTSPSPGATLGFAIGATIEGHDFTGAIDTAVEVGPTGIDPNIVGFRLASGSGLSMQDIVGLGNLATGTNLSLDSAKIPNLAVRNILLSFSEENDPQLCLPLGLHIAGDLYINPTSSALTVDPSSGCSGGAPEVDRTALCQEDTANGCLAAADIDISSDGIKASGLLGGFDVGPLNFQGAEVDLAITPDTQHLVIAGGLSVKDFLSGSADLLISPTQLEFRGSADVFGSGLQAYLDGSASVNLTSLQSLKDVGSFNVTAVLQTTFLHQAEVAIAAPLEKLRPVLQVVDNMIVDLNNGDILEAATALPTQLANLGESIPAPYNQAFTVISNGLSTLNAGLSKADEAGSATLNMLLNGTTINFPGIPGLSTPGFCITDEVDGSCYTTPPVSTLFGTIPGIPGTWVPPGCITTTVDGTCYSVPPFSLTIPGICTDLQSAINGLDCSEQGIFNDLISPVLRQVIKDTTGYDIGSVSLTTFLNDVNNALASGDIFNLSCAEFQAAASASTSPSASVSLAADGDVLSYPFHLGLSWNFAPQSDSVTSDIAALLGNLINPQVGTATCGLPADWNANPDFPGISGSVTADSGVGDSGGSGTANTPPPPSMSVSLADASITEGSSATLSGSVTPTPDSTRQISVNWGDGSAPETITTATDGTFTATHAYPDLSPTGSPSAEYLVVAADATDNLTANASLTVDEAAPSGLTVTGPTAPTAIGAPVSLSGTFSDPAGEQHVVTAVWGDGSTSSITLPAGTTTFTGLSHTYLDEDTSEAGSNVYPVQVSVTDDGMASTAATVPVTVVDVAPSNIALTPLDATGSACPTCAMSTPEQQVAAFQVSFDYPSVTDARTATIDWGDGTSPQTVALGPATRTFDISHVWTEADTVAHPDGRFPVSISITDEDGNTGKATPVETVTNVAPTGLTDCLSLSSDVTSTCPGSVSLPEGSPVAVFGSFSDPSAQDTHTVTIDWGPGWPAATRVQTIELPVGVFKYSATRTFGDEGSYPVQVTVTDDDELSTSATSTVSITNVTPTVSILPEGQTTVQGVPAYLSQAGSPVAMDATASDPGNDPLTLLWGYGDGSTASTLIPHGAGSADLAAPEDPTYAPVSGDYPVSHTWSPPCVYEVSFTATDADGTPATAGTDAVVTGTSPMAWQAGYWASQYRRGLSPQLDCYLGIVQRMSAIFTGPRSVATGPVPLTTAAEAMNILQPSSPSAQAKLQREILTLWLDYANGAFTYAETVHPSGAPVGYSPTFADLMNQAEAVALSPTSTASQMDQMRQFLDGLIGL